MRKLGLLSIGLATLAAPSIFAGDCMIKTNGVVTGSEANRDQAKLEKKIAERFADDGSQSALYFAVLNGDDHEIVRLPVTAQGKSDRVEIPADLAKKMSTADGVKVFNHLTTTDNTNVKSLYFLPYTLKTLPGLNPEDDFHTARSSKANRHAGTGCSTLNLKGQEKLTVIFGNTAG